MTVSETDPGHLEVHDRVGGRAVELDLREDRSVEWSLSAGDITDPGVTAREAALLVSGIIGPVPDRR